MKIALIGFGKMGKEIDAVARQQGETIACVFDSSNPVTPGALKDADVCIEFSRPNVALSNILVAVEAKKDIVVGTTGWHERLPELKDKLKDSGLLYSSNFSLGMNIFQRIVKRASELMNKAAEYDPFVSEIHHRQKADSPSGSALTLANIILANVERKNRILPHTAEGKIDPSVLHV